ncbi:MAG TPA: hypothetical protein VIB62_02660 [Actinomycetota bacterium]
MRDDDEILDAYERELAAEPPVRRSNRGFWLVAGTITFAGVFLVVEIFANRQLKDTIGHAQTSLRKAQAAAERIEARTGSFVGAGVDGLEQEDPSLLYVDADVASRGLDEVSVSADATGWAAAVQARPDACFYLRLTSGAQEPSYGAGTECTGTAALEASDARW